MEPKKPDNSGSYQNPPRAPSNTTNSATAQGLHLPPRTVPIPQPFNRAPTLTANTAQPWMHPMPVQPGAKPNRLTRGLSVVPPIRPTSVNREPDAKIPQSLNSALTLTASSINSALTLTASSTILGMHPMPVYQQPGAKPNRLTTHLSAVPPIRPTSVNRKPDAKIPQLLNRPATITTTRTEALLWALNRLESNQGNIDQFLQLLTTTKDEELIGTKAKFIVNNILHNDSLSIDSRKDLGTEIYKRDLDLAKDILQNAIKFKLCGVNPTISLDLINNALEHQKLELYKAFASNSSFPLDMRIRQSCERAHPTHKTQLGTVFTQELKKLFEKILNGKTVIHGGDMLTYLADVMAEFNNQQWIQTPELQKLIKWGIERETENILEATHLKEETNLIIFRECCQYYSRSEGELDIKAIVQAAARALPTISYNEKSYQDLDIALSSYQKLGLIHEEPIQDVLSQIGMNQCRGLQNNLDYIFVALKYIQNAEKRICILKNGFTGEPQRKTFEYLDELAGVLEYHLDNLNQEERNIILLGISQSVDAMLTHSKWPSDFPKKHEAIYEIFKTLYEKIEDPVLHKKSIQNIIFSTKTQLSQGSENLYEAYLETKDLSGYNFFAAFTEVIEDPENEADFRPEIKELLTPSRDAIHCDPHPYEQRLSEYYFAILKKYHQLLSESSSYDSAMDLLFERFESVKSQGVIIPYFITQWEQLKRNAQKRNAQRYSIDQVTQNPGHIDLSKTL